MIAFITSPSSNRKARGQREAILLVNLDFGWTVLGWIAALIRTIVEKLKVKSAIDSSYTPTADAAQTEALGAHLSKARFLAQDRS